MIVELEKNMVTGMLTVLGKLVNRNAADKSYLALRLAAENGTLKLSTRSSTEQLTYSATIPEKEAFTAFVPMDAFRDAVRSCKKRSVSILYTEDVLTVSDVQIPLMEMDWPVEKEHSRGLSSDLPENVLDLFARAAQIVDRTEPRNILRGINLNKEGITATSGREMIHFPCPMKVESMTIPLPLALLQSKCEDAGYIQFWPENMTTCICMTVGPWEWRTKALSGSFPAWQKVIPTDDVLSRKVTLTPEDAAKLITALRSQPDPGDKQSVWLTQAGTDRLGIQMGDWSCTIPGTFTGSWGDSILSIARKILLHLLDQGHTRIAFSENRQLPFTASGGIGQFIGMPMQTPAHSPNTKPVKTIANCNWRAKLHKKA